MNNRIYNQQVDLNHEDIRTFYDKRASMYQKGDKSRNTSVLLGDGDPGYADKWNEFEKRKVLPILDVKETDYVLDIGCGVGRWAESLLPKCQMYVGIDFSAEMIHAAQEYFNQVKNALFVNASFQKAFSEEAVTCRKYDIVIITGVSMYINDSDLRVCYSRLKDLLNDGAVIYVEESVGVKERLTLQHIWSEGLQDNYDAVYRTKDEYMNLMDALLESTEVLSEGYFHQLDKEKMPETSHWHIIMKKK